MEKNRKGGTGIDISINDRIVWLLLILASIYDVAQKKIPVWLLAAGGAAGAAAGVMTGTVAETAAEIAAVWRDGTGDITWAYGLMPGTSMVLLAFVTREKIGYGDGVLLILLGFLEGWTVMAELLIALFLAALFGVVMIALKRATMRTQIAFVPFLLAAHFLQSVIG